jgi:hypothetical protein
VKSVEGVGADEPEPRGAGNEGGVIAGGLGPAGTGRGALVGAAGPVVVGGVDAVPFSEAAEGGAGATHPVEAEVLAGGGEALGDASGTAGDVAAARGASLFVDRCPPAMESAIAQRAPAASEATMTLIERRASGRRGLASHSADVTDNGGGAPG